MLEANISLTYDAPEQRRFMTWREFVLFAWYHLRLLNWWLYALMGLGFLSSCAIYWLQVRSGTEVAIANGNSLSRFVLETGSGLIAGPLTSMLVVGDPLLEVSLATRAGIYRLLAWRYLLTCFILCVCLAAYIGWTLLFGATYAQQQDPIYILLIWLAPVALMSMLGMLVTFLTRNSTLGASIAVILLMAEVFLHEALLSIPAFYPFFIPYTYWRHDAPDWWINRFTLLGLAIALALACCWRLSREEHLLGDAR